MKMTRLEKILRPFFFFAFSIFLTNGCGFVKTAPPAADPGETAFQDAEAAYQSQSYRKALSLYNTYLTRYPEGPSAPQALMREGEIYQKNKDFSTARKAYQYLMDRYPIHPLAGHAMAETLGTFYREGKYETVISRGEAYLREFGNLEKPADFYVLMGDACMKTGDSAQAVYFYGKYGETGNQSADIQILPRLRASIKNLNREAVSSLMSRVHDDTARGYLLFRLALMDIEEEKNNEGVRVLEHYVETYPEHEFADRAREIIENLITEKGIITGGKKIGCLLPLSGSYEIYGKRALRGIEMALQQDARRDRVSIVVKDSGSDPTLAVQAAEEMFQENVWGIIGPIITAQEVGYSAQDAGVPIVTLTQKLDITRIGDFVFRHFITPEQQVEALADFAIGKLGIHQLAVLYPDEKYGKTFMNLFWNEVKARGGVVTASEPYDTRATDFTDPIRRLARTRDFEAIFIPDAPAKTGLIIPQLAFYDVRHVTLFGTNLWHSPELIRMARKYVRGAVFPEVFFAQSHEPHVAEFVAAFQNTYGELPGFIEALAYDTAVMLLKIINDPLVTGPEDVRNALYQVHHYRGVTGPTQFDENGEAVKRLNMLRIENGGFVEIDLQ